MELEGTRVIAALRAEVWKALNDPEVLKQAIPGCQEMTGSAEEGYAATVVQKVGPVKATFHGEVTLSDIVEGESYTITGQGKGGAAGFAKGGARVRLTDTEDGGTELTYSVEAKVGGKLAQLGNRIIGGFARKMADQFFERFGQIVEGGGDEGGDGGDAPASDAPAGAPATGTAAQNVASADRPE